MIERRVQLFFYTTFIAYASLLLVSSIKAYVFVVAAYAFALFFRLKHTVVETLFFLLLLVVPIEKGLRGWSIWVVSPGPEAWMHGYNFYFGLTIKLVLTLVLALILPHVRIKKFFTTTDILLLLFLFLSGISTLLSPDIPIALLGFIRLLQTVLIFFLAKQLFSEPKNRKLGEIFFVACLLFFGSFGLWQLITGRPLGFYFEDILGSFPYGAVTTDGIPLYRISGFFGHPTFFGSFLSLLLPVGLGLLLETAFFLRKQWLTLAWAVATGLISLIATYSRSSWLAMAAAIPWLSWKAVRTLGLTHLKPLLVFACCMLIAVSALLGASFIIRAGSLPLAFFLDSGRVRLQLLEQTAKMVQAYPWWGIGLNHFTRILASMDRPDNLVGFLYPVHNTIALFASELGIPAAVSFLIFAVLIMKQSFRPASQKLVRFGVWLGALTFIINSQFQALFNQDPTFDLFMVFLGYLAAL